MTKTFNRIIDVAQALQKKIKTKAFVVTSFVFSLVAYFVGVFISAFFIKVLNIKMIHRGQDTNWQKTRTSLNLKKMY